jgi:hypothetical protein
MGDFVLSAPLDPQFIKAFDAATTACFEYERLRPPAWRARENEMLSESANRLGRRLLGSQALLSAVYATLGEGPGQGDVLGALDVLYESGRLEITSPELLRQVQVGAVRR